MDRVRSELIPRLVENGVFGDLNFVSVSSGNSSLLPHFTSSIDIINIITQNKGKSIEEKKFSVVVKIQIDNVEVRRVRNSDLLFSNEVIMYKDILPFLNAESINIAPKFYYGKATEGHNPSEDILIIDNLNEQGFRSSRFKWLIDLPHLLMSVKKLAEFHALSYIKKHENITQFMKHSQRLRRVVMNNDPNYTHTNSIYGAMRRGISYLKTKSPEYNELLEMFSEAVKDVEAWLDYLFTPEEPFSVICHGDFLKNNILYTYDEADNVTDCIFFDFQNSIYASPVIDLSLFLYMHTTEEVRKEHWDELLQNYWTTLRKKVPDNIRLGTFEDFLQHFSERAVYAYCPSSFFLPMMMTEEKIPSMSSFIAMDSDQKLKFLVECGGKNGSKLISDILKHFIEKNYIQIFLDSFNKRVRV